MNTLTRLVAGTLGAGVLAVSGAGLASAAPSDTGTADTGTAGTGAATGAATGSGTGHLAPEPGGTATYVLPGVAAPLPDPTLGVPDLLRVAVTPLGLLADAAGESGGQAAPQGAQAGPGSAES
ncbi:hypothetical protein [Actinomycetospora sp. TBRC 11914]|uniref:hypothetical protein n=1 Tax=Actinomycetospora sp. TBRC 11914 TaxID=2729387 RepID=UPI00145CECD9|nr:hypothetical protein [Actinomycetospora sp. TBRC 11914]NMO91443.1 hypothetical protein [Actinomycetospora sp. TBRC 11914]